MRVKRGKRTRDRGVHKRSRRVISTCLQNEVVLKDFTWLRLVLHPFGAQDERESTASAISPMGKKPTNQPLLFSNGTGDHSIIYFVAIFQACDAFFRDKKRVKKYIPEDNF